MPYNASARSVRHVPTTVFAAAVVLNLALLGVLAHQLQVSPTAVGTPHTAPAAAPPHLPRIDNAPQRQPPVELTVADGAVPDGVTVFDNEIPAVANLAPNLLAALRHAATEAANDGVEFVVNSGWRSAEYQEQLLREAVSQYGSEWEAARWVATPNTSAHVSGDAVDLGPSDATAWLSRHGVRYGLCQIYGNEPWHYELRPAAIDRGCPPLYADPTQDPRMQQ